jgi:uncharacterized repeat protein (TIGR01451 family)/CSLREA domain-containing protein
MSTARHRIIPLLLLSLTAAACQDQLVSPDDRSALPRPQFAQGDDNTWTVNNFEDTNDGACDDTHCTLREAIAAAASGDKIIFATASAQTIELAIEPLYIVGKSLSIDGGGRITVSAGLLWRVFEVDGGGVTRNVSFTGLTITEGDAGTDDGGGIWIHNGASVKVVNSTITDNAAQMGGGIFVDGDAILEIVGSTVKDNFSRADGAGIVTRGEVTMVSSTVSGNLAIELAGGLFVWNGGKATITGSTISENIATGGAGIFVSDGEVDLRSTTITANAGIAGVGGVALGLSAMSAINTIIAGNTSEQSSPDCSISASGFASLGHNLLATSCQPTSGTTATNVTVSPAQVFLEVLQPDLEENGGPTKTHALIPRGRAVDAGYCPGETTDQRGFARPVDDAAMPNKVDGCDIGAYELQGPFVARTDLIISQSANKTSVKQGDLLTYTVRVRNLGPETAPNVVVTNVLSTGVTFVSATHAKGSHTAPPVGETGTVTWYLGDMLDQANETTEIKVTVRIKGKTTVTNTASVTSDAVDPNTANNTAALTVSVAAGSTKPPAKGR